MTSSWKLQKLEIQKTIGAINKLRRDLKLANLSIDELKNEGRK